MLSIVCLLPYLCHVPGWWFIISRMFEIWHDSLIGVVRRDTKILQDLSLRWTNLWAPYWSAGEALLYIKVMKH